MYLENIERGTSMLKENNASKRLNYHTKTTKKKGIPLGKILKLRKRGFNFSEVAMLLGCTKQSIWKRVKDWESGKLSN